MPTKTTAKRQEEEHVLDDLLVVQLRGIYDVEMQLAKALPRLVKKGANPDLKEAFEQYRAQTEHSLRRLGAVFAKLEIKLQKLPSAAIRGLIEDADWVVKNILGAAAIDAGLVAALQAVQHYKLALYGTALEWAKVLELQEAVDILEEILHDADGSLEELDALAGAKINEAALGDDSEAEAEGGGEDDSDNGPDENEESDDDEEDDDDEEEEDEKED